MLVKPGLYAGESYITSGKVDNVSATQTNLPLFNLRIILTMSASVDTDVVAIGRNDPPTVYHSISIPADYAVVLYGVYSFPSTSSRRLLSSTCRLSPQGGRNR